MIDNVSASINDYYTDLEESKKIVDNININYNDFKEKSIEVKDGIKDISTSFDFYLEEFDTKNKDLLIKINNIENSIIEISDISIKLNSECKYDLNNKNLENKYNNYKINYKNMIDSYNEMIDVYNEVINSYNEYQKEEENNQVEKYESNISMKVDEVLVSIS